MCGENNILLAKKHIRECFFSRDSPVNHPGLTSGFAIFLGASEKWKWQSAWHIVYPQMCRLILASVIIPCLPCTQESIYINKRLNTMSIAPPGVAQEVAQEGLIHTGRRQSTVWMGVVQEVAQPLIPHSYSKQMCIECLPWARHCWELVIQPGAGRQGPCSDLLMSVFLLPRRVGIVPNL